MYSSEEIGALLASVWASILASIWAFVEAPEVRLGNAPTGNSRGLGLPMVERFPQSMLATPDDEAL
jgi:hypothetical protein